MGNNSYKSTGHLSVYNPETDAIEQKAIEVQVTEFSAATQLDVIEAQVAYTAMMTDTLLEV